MTGLETIGVLSIVLIGFFLPRLVGAVTGGVLLGGLWWCLFLPLGAIGVAVDLKLWEDSDF